MEKQIKKYILVLLEYQKTRLECINLGFSPSNQTKIELKMIEEAKKLVKNKLNIEEDNL